MNSGMYGTGNVRERSTSLPQEPNTVLLGPTKGNPGTPSFRSLVPADFPVRMAEFFGQGDDGDFTISTSNLTSGPFTNGALTRDAHINNLTMVAGGSININGYRLFVRGVLDLRSAGVSAISAPGVAGSNASGATAGAAGVPVIVKVLGAHGAGGAGSAGVASGNSGASTGGGGGTADHTARGGSGGAGGAGSTGVPGSSGSNSPNNNGPCHRNPSNILVTNIGFVVGGCGGAGGTGGTGDATNSGGGGGGGGTSGGVAWIGAHTIIRGAGTAAGCISAIGGAGGTGAAGVAGNSGGGGGGAGGSGGLIYLIYHELLGAVAPNALDVSGGAGGDGGAGKGTGLGGDGGGGGGGGRVYLLEYAGNPTSTSWVTRMQSGTTTATTGNLNVGATPGTGAAGVSTKFSL